MLSFFFPASLPRGSDPAVRRSTAMEDGIMLKSITSTMPPNAAASVHGTGADGTRLVKQVGTAILRTTPTPRALDDVVGKCSVAAQTVSQGGVVGRSISPSKPKAPAVAATSALLLSSTAGEVTPSQEVSTTAATSHMTSHMHAVGDTRSSSLGEKAIPSQSHASPASSEHSNSSHDDRDPSLFNKQVAKLKRFFTTLQEFANKISQEVAEQVQELITALVNGTVTVVEFHQEIQSVTNHPLKEFIIPFLKDSLEPLRQHLKASSQDIADILEVVQNPGPSLGLTPQLIDTELPVLPSTKPPAFMSTPSASSLSPLSASPITRVPSSPPPRPSNLAIFSSGNMEDPEFSPNASPPVSSSGSRKRTWNAVCQDRGRGQYPDLDRVQHTDPEKATTTKRPKPHVSADPECVAPSTELAAPHPPTLQQPHPPTLQQPHPPTLQQPHPPTLQQPQANTSSIICTSGGAVMTSVAPTLTAVAVTPSVMPVVTPTVMDVRATQTNNLPATMAVWLNEDWGHIDVMLGTIQQMLEKTHNAVNTLRDRLSVVELAIHQTRTEQERKEELEKEVERRVSEAVEKVRLAAADERQKLLSEASKQMIETVNSVHSEMEGRITQAQALAVEEALKQANAQSNTKEMCWNCGRRATETCSGCNKARYCGTFCQHKDWSKHMHDCSSGIQGMEVDREQETADRPILGHGNDIIQPAPRARGSMSSDTAAQGRDEDKKVFNSLTHTASMI